VISREAIPMTKVIAAAKMKAPITSNRISDNDITHQEMRLQPSVAAGACSYACVGDGDAREKIIAVERYVAKAEPGLFTSPAGGTTAAIEQLCGVEF
jgi:hypothetical protein